MHSPGRPMMRLMIRRGNLELLTTTTSKRFSGLNENFFKKILSVGKMDGSIEDEITSMDSKNKRSFASTRQTATTIPMTHGRYARIRQPFWVLFESDSSF